MREIVTIQAGECGNRIGSKFWKVISEEHEIDPRDGKFIGDTKTKNNRVNVFFKEAANGYYQPRSILADTEPGVLDEIRSGEHGKLYNPDNFIYGKYGAKNIFSQGHYSKVNADLKEGVMDQLRKEAEECDCLQGFQILHAVGGGTGSGFGCQLMDAIKIEYPDRINLSYSVFPSSKISNSIIEPYNTVLSFINLILNIDICMFLDNEALYRICFNNLNLPSPKYGDLNNLISSAMSSVTSTMRFPGQRNADLRKQAVNLVPYHRLHFFMLGHSPITREYEKLEQNKTVQQLTKEIFSKENLMCSADTSSGKYISTFTIFRGDIAVGEVDQEMLEMKNKNSPKFVDWVPNVSTSCCDIPLKGCKNSATLVGNNTSIKYLFENYRNRFNMLYKKKAFLHSFLAEGMDEMEFTEAESMTCDLISEYQQYQDAISHSCGEYDDDEEEE